MKQIVLVICLMLSSISAFAGNRTVSGWYSCRFSSGMGSFWYTQCHLNGTFESDNCQNAFDKLKQIDCCQEHGAVAETFNKISCKE